MQKKRQLVGMIVIVVMTSLVIFGCRITSEPSNEPPATPTPTDLPDVLIQPEKETNTCADLSGNLEMQILVGPSEVVGMEPVAVGEIPFSVVFEDGLNTIEGSGPLNFDEQIYEAEWGTYSVSFNANSEISGTCTSTSEGDVLHMTVVMEGEQMVSVMAEGLQADYPWTGTQEISISLPAEEGASESGKGWVLVLHLAP